MSSVDDRIVNMQFNNKQFTEGVAQTEKSLQSLEGSLQKTAKGGGLDQMASSVETVKARFGALQVAGVAAVATIASKATSAGLNLLKSFTIDPIMQGFQEYQTGLNSIQTIMANTGKSVKVVNAALDELNEFSDQTIYNFAEMAKNVGTFTAAGVDLDTSVQSIKGIANLAAVSGSSSQQASNAMYQLSQAIAAGRVSLQDWNSVVNAGMGGAVFQKALARTATNMGTLEKSSVALVGPMDKLSIAGMSFRESIQAGGGGPQWLTSDVLVDTLKQIAGGYSLMQLKAKGYSDEEAKAILTLQRRAFDAATKIKTLPQLVGVIQESVGSTFSQIFRTIIGDFEQSKKLFSDIGYAILGPRGVLTKMQNAVTGFVSEWAELGGRDLALEGLKDVGKTVLAVFRNLRKAFMDVFPSDGENALFNFTQGFANLAEALRPSRATLLDIRSIFAGVFSVIKLGLTIVSVAKNVIVGFIKGIFNSTSGASGGLLSIAASVAEVITSFQKMITSGGKVTEFASNLGNVAGAALSPIIAAVGLIIKGFAALASGDGIDAAMAPFNAAKGALADFVGGIFAGLAVITAPFEKLSDFFDGLRVKMEAVGDSFSSVTDGVSSISSQLGGFFGGTAGDAGSATSSAMGQISDKFSEISSAASGAKDSVSDMYGEVSGAGATAASAAAGKASEGWENLKSVLSAIGNGIKTTFEKLGEFASSAGENLAEVFGKIDALGLASFMNALFTGALILTIRDFAKSFREIGPAIVDTFGELQGSLQELQGAVKAVALRNIAIGLGILVAALIALTFIDQQKLIVGLTAIGVLLGLVTIAMAQISKIGATVDENGDTITKFNFNLLGLAAAVFTISAAMIALAIAVKIFSTMNLGELAKGLGAMAIALGIVVGAMFLFSKIGGSIEGMAASILVISLAMNLLAGAIAVLGNLSMETLAKGLGAMGVGLAIMVGAMLAMDKIKGSVEGLAGSIFVIAAAMVVMSGAVAVLGNLSMETLAKGLGAMGIGLALMVGALALLSANQTGALAAGGAMVLMATALNILATVIILLGTVPWEAATNGIKLVALALGVLLVAGAIAMVIAPGLYALGITIGLLGAAMALAGVGMLAFGTGFALLVASGVAGIAIITLAIQAFMALLPSIAIQVAAAFVTFLEVIAAAAPRIRKAVGEIMKAFLGGIRDQIPEIRKLVVTLINNMIEIVRQTAPNFIDLGWELIDKFITKAEEKLPGIIDTGIELVRQLIEGIGDGVPILLDEAGKTIVKLIQGLADAIETYSADIRAAGADVAWELVDGLTGGLLGRGIEMVADAARELAASIPGPIRKFLGIESPSKLTMEMGRYVAEGLARGITQNANGAVKAAVAMANAVIAAGNDKVLEAQRKFSALQRKADAADAKADITARRAAEARAAADKFAKKNPKAKEAIKKREKAVKAIERAAAKERALANQAQSAADRSQRNVEAVRQFEEASNVGKGDILQERAVSLSAAASKQLAKANAEAAEARRLMETNKKAGKAMLEQARKDAKKARELAAAAQKANAEANKFYQKDVEERIKQLEEDAKFEAADDKGKAEILKARAEANDAKAAQQKALAESLVEQAKAIAAKNAAEALRLVAAAEEAAALAKEAASQAQQERDQAEQLLNPGGTTGTTPGTSIQPSRSILEDAANAVDRYTASLRMAEDLAAAQQGTIQFVQNNNSPEALSASEIYRQSKNLLSAAEIKMGAVPES